MEIKVIQVGIERNKPLYKVIGSNFGKRDFEVNVFRAVNPIQAIEQHVDEDDKGVGKVQTPGGIQQVKIITESGVY